MINITQAKDCCGCGACAQICSRNCITMTADAEGFLYPQLDTASCIRCNACDKVCPILTHKTPEASAVEAYAAYAQDQEVRNASSSGGLFSLLAQWVLKNGGVVFGAAFAEDFSVHHVRIRKEEELPLLRGSKYVQSRIEDTYREVRSALTSGQTVLFTGVACQIAGLKAFLKKDYAQLYTVDVLCHGVPSPKIWQQYLRAQETAFGSKVQDVKFRSKTLGWKVFSMELSFRNGAIYSKPFPEDAFMQFFLENICLRPSCHDCRFKSLPRSSDLTLGDAWGIGGTMPDMDDDGGTSIVLVNTEKGQALFQNIRQHITLRQGDADTLLPPGADSRISVAAHPRRKAFFAAASIGASVEKLLQILQGTFLQRACSCAGRLVKKLLHLS